jgi:hypothetical protein
MQDERNFGSGSGPVGTTGLGTGAGSAAGTGAGAANTPRFEGAAGGTGGGGLNQPSTESRDVKERVRDRAEERVNDAMHRAAGPLESAADRIERLADRQSDDAQLGSMAHSVADGLEAASNYLRGHDLRGLLDDMERMVDRRPTQSLLVAIGAGWLVGKLLR